MPLDELVFQWINGMAGHFPLLDGLMLLLAEWPGPGVPLIVALLWFLPGPSRRARRQEAVLIALAVILALGVAELPRLVYLRPRPFEIHRVTLLVKPTPIPSFPSTHISVISAALAALGQRAGRWGVLAWALTAGCMFGRVFIGVHFPLDTLGGLAVGWGSGALIYHNRDTLRDFAQRIVTFGEELL